MNLMQVLKNSDEFFRSTLLTEESARGVTRRNNRIGCYPVLSVQKPGAVAYQRVLDLATRSSSDRSTSNSPLAFVRVDFKQIKLHTICLQRFSKKSRTKINGIT
jgi:hypothetical protein